MSATPMPLDITESMEVLLDWFAEQPCSCATIGHITHDIEYTRETVRTNLKQLMAADCAERRHKSTGEYRLIKDPRNEQQNDDDR